MLTYSISSGLAMIVLYAVYHISLRLTTFFSFNRRILLSILLFASLSPLINLRDKVSQAVVSAGIQLPDLEVRLITATPQPDTLSAIEIITAIYACGLIVTATWALLNILFITYILFTSHKTKIGETEIRVHTHGKLSPFSWGNMIFISEDLLSDRHELDIILMHESSHRHHLHWVDLLFANIIAVINWYNPCSWVILRELIRLHEYEADRDTLTRCDNPVEYQLLLIKKTAGSRFHAFADSLNHSSLKTRITMMMKNQTKSSARLRALAMLPMMAAALCVSNVSCVNDEANTVPETEVTSDSNQYIATLNYTQNDSDKSAAANQVEATVSYTMEKVSLPEFEGGMTELYKMISDNIKYPDEAMKKEISGRVILNLIIGTDGEIKEASVIKGVEASLDKEALAVIDRIKEKGAKFSPAIDENGKAVQISYTLPISFKLQ